MNGLFKNKTKLLSVMLVCMCSLSGVVYGAGTTAPVIENNNAKTVGTVKMTTAATDTEETFTVVFDTQGGSSLASKSVKANASLFQPSKPSYSGYEFDGWYKDKAGNTAWNFSVDTVTADTTLYVKWVPVIYKMTFNTHSGSSIESLSFPGDTIIAKPTSDTTRDGFKFDGWYQDSAYTIPWDFATDKATNNITIHAKWTPIMYDITFNTQGGSSISVLSVQGSTLIKSPSQPTKVGYKFGGWYKEAAGTTEWKMYSDKVAGNTILYAKWENVAYLVKFNTQGGNTILSQKYDYNKTIVKPTDPTKKYYVFAGWYKDPECQTAFNFSSDKVVDDTIIYAKWEGQSLIALFPDTRLAEAVLIEMNKTRTTKIASINDKVVIEADLKTIKNLAVSGMTNLKGIGNLTNLTNLSISSGRSLTAIPSEIGLLLKITNLSIVGTGITSLPKEIGNLKYLTELTLCDNKLTSLPDTIGNFANLTYLGVTANQLKTLPAAIGNCRRLTTLDVSANQLIALPNEIGNLTQLTYLTAHINHLTTLPPTMNKLTKLKVLNLAQNSIKDKSIVDPIKLTNKTVSINLTEQQMQVAFSSQGGTAVAALTVTESTLVTKPTNPTKSNYTFGGWYKESKFTNVWNFATDKVLTDTNLYAKWVATITFDSMSGSGVSAKVSDLNTIIAKPTDPKRTGYTFSGWYKDSAYKTVWDFTTGKVTADTILYAKWLANDYTVTFNSQGGSAITPKYAPYNTTITIPPTPSRSGGYLFVGWYKDSAFKTAWNFTSEKVTANTTLYAKWEGKSLISLMPDQTMATAVLAEMNKSRNVKIASVNDKAVIQTDLDGVTSLLATGVKNMTGIRYLAHLSNLTLEGNSQGNLTTVSTEVGYLTELKTLNLNGNSITTLPEQIGNLKSLTQLNVVANKITVLPDAIGSLTNLTVLNANTNQLKSLPKTMTNLKNLKVLILSFNKISDKNSVEQSWINTDVYVDLSQQS
ncbi:InlB B-repeat-containing protein [Acetobacterium sp.]|uniref:InlB B-repeat-containing protein n=1 Tax=Acetobacterium sp. TaxID=1872094 RepID=UPI002F3FFE85